ncbi:MAG: WG repeat-containing protein [Bacteroidota bacterium]
MRTSILLLLTILGICNHAFSQIDKAWAKAYDELVVIHTNLIKVQKSGKWGIVSQEGQSVVPVEYDEIGRLYADMLKVRKGDKWGLLNQKGELILPAAYEALGTPSWGIVSAKKEGKWGFVKSDGTIASDFEFDEAEKFLYKLSRVRIGELWGLVNREGEKILAVEYAEVRSLDYGFFMIRKDSLVGLYKRDRSFLPMDYSSISIENNKDLVRSLTSKTEKPVKVDASSQNFEPEPMLENFIHARKAQSLEIYASRGNLIQSFESASSYEKGIAKAELNGQKVYINKIGDVLGEQK